MPKVQWRAPEFEEQPKGVSWYWLTIILASGMLAAAIWQKNFLFGFFIVVAEVLLLVWGSRTPALIDFSLSEKEIVVAGKTRPFAEMESFSVYELEEGKRHLVKLYFRRHLQGALRLLVPHDAFLEVEKILMGVLPRVERDDSFIETLEKFFRF